MAVGHRVGVVMVGEPSVIIAVSSAHRRDSLEVNQTPVYTSFTGGFRPPVYTSFTGASCGSPDDTS